MADGSLSDGRVEAVSARPTSWRLLVALFLLTGLVETIGFSHYLTYNFRILQSFGLDDAQVRQWVGILGSLSFLLGLPLAPFWGSWADKYSRRLIITRSAFIETFFFAFIALSQNLPQLLASASLAGLVLGNTGVMFAVLSEVAPRKRVGLSLAIVGSSGPLGFAVGPLLGGTLLNGLALGPLAVPAVPLRTLLLGDAALSLTMALLVVLLFDEPRRPHASQTRVLAQVRDAILTVVRTPVLRTLFLIAVFGYIAQRLGSSYMPLFIAGLYKGADTERVIGLVVGTSSAALGLLAAAWGAAGDRFGHARTLLVSILGTAAGFALLSQTRGLEALAAVWIGLGCLQAGINPMFYTLIALRAPASQRSTVLTFAYFPLYFGGLIGPAIGAFLVTAGTPVPVLFLLGAGVLTVAAAIALTLLRR